jgi:alpha-tubulin suppressor-like RCC1 family protein
MTRIACGALVLLGASIAARAQPLQVSVGKRHACAVVKTPAGAGIHCWGMNEHGQLGDGTHLPRLRPTPVLGFEDRPGPLQVASGVSHTCALAEGIVSCWGNNRDGQLGDGTTVSRPRPAPVLDLPPARQVAVAGRFGCALLRDSTVRCWGHDFFGDLGDGRTNALRRPKPVAVVGLTRVTQIALGDEHSCALLRNGKVRCWGDNFHGRLGDGTTEHRSTPVATVGLRGVTQIAVGDAHSCARTRRGRLFCWGSSVGGSTGRLEWEQRRPELVPGLDGVTFVSAGGASTCVLRHGKAICFGEYSARGDFTPTPVPGLGPVSEVYAGRSGVCARGKRGSVHCWGSNDFGQLGDGSSAIGLLPKQAHAPPAAIAELALGERSCARLVDGTVACWGPHSFDCQEGADCVRTHREPARVLALQNVRRLFSGENGLCALLAGGEVRCWGLTKLWGLPDGSEVDPAIRDAAELVFGDAHFANPHGCLRRPDGRVACWGSNASGQLGDGSYRDHATPVDIEGLRAESIAARTGRTCALRVDRTVACWGENANGELGDGTRLQRNRPVPVAGLAEVEEIALGGRFGCARVAGGRVRCWGENGFGQLGDGTEKGSAVPTEVLGVTGAVRIGAGDLHACALLADGTVRCWGANVEGTLGDGTTLQRSTPVAVHGLAGAKQLTVGTRHACAEIEASAGGGLRCWGRNDGGQLTGGSPSRRLEHAPVAW